MSLLKKFFRKKQYNVIEPYIEQTKNESNTVQKELHNNQEYNSTPKSYVIEGFDMPPKYISERFIYDNQEILCKYSLAVDFSKLVIKALFGFDEKLCNNCLCFSELENPKKVSGFGYLWNAIFGLCKEKLIIQNSHDTVAYDDVFNYQNGKLLIEKAEKLVVQKTVSNNIAEVIFESCIPTKDFLRFNGYTDFDFITALSILSLKTKYPNIHTVRANVYFIHGVPLENIDFPVKVEATVDQRYIYGLINSR